MASKPGSGQGGAKPPADPKPTAERHADDPVLQVRIISSDEAAFVDFVKHAAIEFACAGPRVSSEGIISADVLLKQSETDAAAGHGKVRVEVVADLSAVTGRNRAEVGRGNRFEDPRVLPAGRGVLVRTEQPS